MKLTEIGEELLQEKGFLELGDNRRTINNHLLDHELLLSWTIIHLGQIEDVLDSLSFYPICPETLPKHAFKTPNKKTIPDAIFCIVRNTDHKALLFFLEVDMGSESISSTSGANNTIQEKIVSYQSLFYTNRYQRIYWKKYGFEFSGFRLLFLANSQSNHVRLCRAVQENQQSDFIWLSHQALMFESGITSNIWFPGGNLGQSPKSILGSMSCETPLLMPS